MNGMDSLTWYARKKAKYQVWGLIGAAIINVLFVIAFWTIELVKTIKAHDENTETTVINL